MYGEKLMIFAIIFVFIGCIIMSYSAQTDRQKFIDTCSKQTGDYASCFERWKDNWEDKR